MGFRTVVVLYNDQAHEWENDPELGKKIAAAMNHVAGNRGNGDDRADLNYGRVVECQHADTQTLAVLDGYQFTPIVYSTWTRGEHFINIVRKLLKAALMKVNT